MNNPAIWTRRAFLKTSLFSALTASTSSVWCAAKEELALSAGPMSTRVALTAGDDRAYNVFRGLQPFKKEIQRAIGQRRVVIKPNFVSTEKQLAATHADSDRIEVMGARIADHIKPYKLHDQVEKQLVWMTPERPATRPW